MAEARPISVQHFYASEPFRAGHFLYWTFWFQLTIGAVVNLVARGGTPHAGRHGHIQFAFNCLLPELAARKPVLLRVLAVMPGRVPCPRGGGIGCKMNNFRRPIFDPLFSQGCPLGGGIASEVPPPFIAGLAR